jgi:hypothetical protein
MLTKVKKIIDHIGKSKTSFKIFSVVLGIHLTVVENI